MTEEAIDYYKEAIRIRPDYALAHYNLGVALVVKGEDKKAVHHFRETVSLRPDLAVAQKKLEMALLRLEKR
jgi:tetratricopeptide (TPR) repeat protein